MATKETREMYCSKCDYVMEHTKRLITEDYTHWRCKGCGMDEMINNKTGIAFSERETV